MVISYKNMVKINNSVIFFGFNTLKFKSYFKLIFRLEILNKDKELQYIIHKIVTCLYSMKLREREREEQTVSYCIHQSLHENHTNKYVASFT